MSPFDLFASIRVIRGQGQSGSGASKGNTMLTLGHYLTVSGLLFTIGFAGVASSSQHHHNFYVPGSDVERGQSLSHRFLAFRLNVAGSRITALRCLFFSLSLSRQRKSRSGSP
jgi:hypothetical protein